jgi:hypothetical protein
MEREDVAVPSAPIVRLMLPQHAFDLIQAALACGELLKVVFE